MDYAKYILVFYVHTTNVRSNTYVCGVAISNSMFVMLFFFAHCKLVVLFVCAYYNICIHNLYSYCFTACSCLPLVEGGQPPNTFVRTNLIRVPRGIQGPLGLSCTEVIEVCVCGIFLYVRVFDKYFTLSQTGPTPTSIAPLVGYVPLGQLAQF